MKLRVLGCSGGSAPGRRPTSFLVNDEVAVDAGALTAALAPADQIGLRHLVLSHAHLDHVATLPFLLDNRFERTTSTLHLHAAARTFHDLRTGLFNRRLWPDLDLLRESKAVTLDFHEVEPRRSFQAGSIEITASEMEHPVPCLGYLLRAAGSSIFIAGDTGSIASVTSAVAGTRDLRAIVVEVSWPDRLQDLARVAGHLTPSMLAQAWPLHPAARVLVTHIKPMFLAEVTYELAHLGLDVEILADDQVIDLG